MKKTILINFFVLFFLLIFGEFFFGTWFKSNNFGTHLRGHINAKVKMNTSIGGIKKEFIFFRNSNAFRNYEVPNSEIDVVFVGGSTTIQSYLPYEETIVGYLNEMFREKNILFANAGMEGKSTYGYLCDFKYWFSKLSDLNPKYYIFYTGYNDTWNFENPKKFNCDNITSSSSKIKKIIDYSINNSFILSNLKILKHDLFQKKIEFEISTNKDSLEYVTFEKANKKFYKYKKSEKDKIIINNYKQNLEKLKKIFVEHNIKPIFITQVSNQGNENHLTYLINNETKTFAKENGYLIFKLDEEIKLSSEDFYDYVHNNANGSKKVATYIYNNILELF